MTRRLFLHGDELTDDELRDVLRLAIDLRHRRARALAPGRTIAMLFFDPSLRTRVSFEVAMQRLGGSGIELKPGAGMWKLETRAGVVMDGDASEHIIEAARVLSEYVDVIGVRSFARLQSADDDRRDEIVRGFAEHATVPVVNMESAMAHPCQGLADLAVIEDLMGADGRQFVLTWANHPKPLPLAVPHSAAYMAARGGMHVTIAHPEGYELDPGWEARARAECERHGRRFRVVHSMEDALPGAHVVYAKSWGSRALYGRPDLETERRRSLGGWIVDEAKLARTPDARFMHCLPVRRNVVVADEVLDGPRSIVTLQAAYRLHVQQALLSLFLGGESCPIPS